MERVQSADQSAHADPPEAPERQVRAVFDTTTITVYQAYSPAIAESALVAQTFVAPFDLGRMTWIKPSFLWMMYRSGWGLKAGQERVVAVHMLRVGFDRALEMSCLSHFHPGVYADHAAWQQRRESTDVRVQWDPERDILLERRPWRAIQVGLAGRAIRAYVNEWVTAIDDVSETVREVHELVLTGELGRARSRLPPETVYPLPANVVATVGAG